MKTVILLILALALPLSAQEFNRTYQTTRTIDDTDTLDVFYLYWPQVRQLTGGLTGTYGVQADTTEDVENEVSFNRRLLITGYADSLKTSTVIDSLWGWVRPLDFRKIPFGDSLYFDFVNHDTATAYSGQARAFLEGTLPFNRSSSKIDTANFWLDLSNIVRDCHGIEVGIGQRFMSVADSVGVDLNILAGYVR